MTVVLRMTARRIALLIPLLLGITLLVFLIAQLLPGDPAESALGVFADAAAKQRFIEQNHLDDPVWVRYPRFLAGLLHGDLGVSLVNGRKVTELITTALPVTVQLTALAMTFALIVALVGGVWSALRPGRIADTVVRVLSMGGLAAPAFWVGLLLIQYLAVDLGWFPASGYEPPSAGLWHWLRTLTLPAVALGLGVGASLMRVVRSSMLEELQRDYVRTARGAGLHPVTVLRGVLRNALITPLTVFGVRIGMALSGAVLIETIFTIPGMGQLLMNSVQTGDLAVIQGLVLFSTCAFVLVNLVVDLGYLMLNPRIREA